MKKKRQKFVKPGQSKDSDNEDPNPESHEYFHDDIDDFHANKDKISLDNVEMAEASSSDEEEMVLGIESDSEEEDESNLYQKCKQQLKFMKEKNLRDAKYNKLKVKKEEYNKKWGDKKYVFYGGLGDEEYILSGSDGEIDAAILEEKEALSLQKKMAQNLDDADFGFDMLAPPEKSEATTEKITKDLTKLSKKEKLEIVKKESPELLELLNDLKVKLTEVKDVLLPLQQLLLEEEETVPAQTLAYVQLKLRLTLSYCINVNFYLKLKSDRFPVKNHPIVKRLLQYRNLLKQMQPLDEQFHSEMEMLATCLKSGEEVQFVPIDETDIAPKQQQLSKVPKDEMAETNGEGLIDSNHIDADDEEEINGEGADKKRAITYQMEKNKGLTRYSKKEKANPRVKHRTKFKKAKIRRKGQVRQPMTEMKRYGGELFGIRSGVKHSIKLK
ncbi:something about silencing protein 10 isoform X1 [Octopus sinensis]|uniref:Something about silencing protein 10 isoform X1 n=1 Tax=Octopus sinensis TaxID=2607531 RepID=A0A6P7T691_9MOLL|nr:something about silencing protein 10 isoform X1 [Octopus sinensis]